MLSFHPPFPNVVAFAVIMSQVSDIDQAGNVLCTYTKSEQDELKIVSCFLFLSYTVFPRWLPSAQMTTGLG